MINQALVAGDILFATSSDRCSYLNRRIGIVPNGWRIIPASWRYVQDVLEEEAGLFVKTETEVRTVDGWARKTALSPEDRSRSVATDSGESRCYDDES